MNKQKMKLMDSHSFTLLMMTFVHYYQENWVRHGR